MDFDRHRTRGDGRRDRRVRATFAGGCVNAEPGLRTSDAAKNRATLLRYFAERHRHAERLVLQRFTYKGYSRGNANFTFELVRGADDLARKALYGGKGAITCWGHGGIAVWAMGPEATLSLEPEPTASTPPGAGP